MPTTVDVPLTIQPDAAELVAQLGMQKELDLMLEQARRTIPNLRRLEVSYAEPYDTGIEDVVLIEAYRSPEGDPLDHSAEDAYSHWRLATFSPDVLIHFTFLLWDIPEHGG